jgi:hypothetical protein
VLSLQDSPALAPWTDEQVVALNAFQTAGRFHPFTCGNDRGDENHRKVAKERGDRDFGLLVATKEGWVCPACDYRQNWAHPFMAGNAF